MNHDAKLAALRRVEFFPVHDEDGDVRIHVHDTLRLTDRTLVLSVPAYALLGFFDGQHSLNDIQDAFRREHGAMIAPQQLADLASALDEACLLQNDRSQRALAARQDAYRTAPARDNRDRYPPADGLRAEIDAILASAAPTPVHDLRGIVAPHLDYDRGRACYAHAYATLAATVPADRYVILGTNHFGHPLPAVATGKDFLTPLGTAATDTAFLDGLEAALGHDLRSEEFDHACEHSIELQVHMLQVVHAERPFRIVPILCHLDPFRPDAAADLGGFSLAEFADALGQTVAASAGRTVIIAGADMSHVGRRFGDFRSTTPELLADVERYDRSLLSMLGVRREDFFLSTLCTSRNQTNICSTACVFAVLRALPDHPCRVLHYHQAADPSAETTVTCFAAAIGT